MQTPLDHFGVQNIGHLYGELNRYGKTPAAIGSPGAPWIQAFGFCLAKTVPAVVHCSNLLRSVASCGIVVSMSKTKSIRISHESHQALKKHAPWPETITAAADRAIASLDGVYVVITESFEGTDIVEVYQCEGDAFNRRSELTESGVENVTVASRAILDYPDPFRHFGQRWKDAVGWTSAYQWQLSERQASANHLPAAHSGRQG